MKGYLGKVICPTGGVLNDLHCTHVVCAKDSSHFIHLVVLIMFINVMSIVDPPTLL